MFLSLNVNKMIICNSAGNKDEMMVTNVFKKEEVKFVYLGRLKTAA